MNWQNLMLSAEGRIGRKDFWLGALALFMAWLISPALHIFAPLLWVVLLYPWICVLAKRLHDFGKSAWLILIPAGVGLAALTLAAVFGGVGVLSAVLSSAEGDGSHVAWPAMIGAFGLMMAFLGIAALVKVVFILWVGLSPSDPGTNRFGPPPAQAPAPAPPTAG